MGSTGSEVAQLVIVVLLLAYIIGRRFMPRPVRDSSRRWRVPLIVSAVGVYLLVQAGQGQHAVHWNGADVGYLAIGVAVSLIGGVARGATVRIYDQGGVLMQRYRVITAVIWVLLIAIRAGMDLAAHSWGVDSAVAGASVLLMFGATLLAEAAMIALRVPAATGTGPAGWSRPGLG